MLFSVCFTVLKQLTVGGSCNFTTGNGTTMLHRVSMFILTILLIQAASSLRKHAFEVDCNFSRL